MIGFIKKLISGIINFFVGLLGGKKGNDYYLELKEDTNEDNLASNAKKAVETATSNAKKAVETAKSNTQKAVETVTSNTQKAVETVTSNTQEVAETAKSKTKKATKKVAETAPAVNNGKKDPATTTKANPAEVELVQTAKGLKAQPASKANAPIAEQPKETTFAPNYLVPTNSNGRRRPGANMSSFLDMASQVKNPR